MTQVTASATYVLYGMLLISAAIFHGCVPAADNKRAITIELAKEYLRNTKPGTPVTQIEKDLELPPPTKTEAPASTSPGWKFRYFARDLVVYFVADSPSHGERKDFVYVGDASVETQAEFYREFREMEKNHTCRGDNGVHRRSHSPLMCL